MATTTLQQVHAARGASPSGPNLLLRQGAGVILLDAATIDAAEAECDHVPRSPLFDARAGRLMIETDSGEVLATWDGQAWVRPGSASRAEQAIARADR